MLARVCGAIGGALLLVAACRPGKGERCFCEGECRSGFVCAANGAILEPGRCVNEASDSVESGTCIEASNQQNETDELNPPPSFDLGSWATDPAVTTTPATDATMTDATTNVTMSTTEESTSSSSSSSGTDTDTDTGTSSSSSSGSSSSSSSSGSSSSSSTGAATGDTM